MKGNNTPKIRGSGYNNKIVHGTVSPRGAGVRAVSPSASNQIGMAMGNLPGHRYEAPNIYQGQGYPTKFGNEKAKEVGIGGPGVGREVMRSGTQGVHGPVAGERPGPARGLDTKGRLP
jgi:hypothetical protein